MIPRLKPALGWAELKAAISPPGKDDVRLFEEAFAKLMDQKYALAFPYGRTGMIFLLEALGLKDKEIICPAYTCVVVPHAIVYSGNRPVFVDCAAGEFNMDLDQAEAAINENTGAIIATSLFGYPVNLEKLDEIKKRHPHIHIIQDCAHSFAAEWKGRPVQKEGVAAVFGLNISKILTSIFGGMITTDDEKVYLKLNNLRNSRLKKPSWGKSAKRLLYLLAVYPIFWGPVYGLINRLERSGLLNKFVKYYDESKIDMPLDYLQQMISIEARVGRENIRRYDKIIQNRREAALVYFEKFGFEAANNKKLDFVSPATRPDVRDQHSPFTPPLKVEGATYSHFTVQVSNRDEWLKQGIKNGVQVGWLIEYNIPEMNAYGRHSPEGFPIAARYARTTINLPVWCGKNIAAKVVKLTRNNIGGN